MYTVILGLGTLTGTTVTGLRKRKNKNTTNLKAMVTHVTKNTSNTLEKKKRAERVTKSFTKNIKGATKLKKGTNISISSTKSSSISSGNHVSINSTSHGGGSIRHDIIPTKPAVMKSQYAYEFGINVLGDIAEGRIVTDDSINMKHGTWYPTKDNWENGNVAGNRAKGSVACDTSPSGSVHNSSMGTIDTTEESLVTYDQLTEEEYKRLRMPSSVDQDRAIYKIGNKSAWDDPSKKQEMLNENKSIIQNEYGFPYYHMPSFDTRAAKYDYQIIPGDKKSSKTVSMEDKLKEARAVFGIHVHGSNDIARAVKFNLYNRYKSPDTNMIFNRMTTHVFFTRPDLNLLDCPYGGISGPNRQVKMHSDTSLLYATDPYIFRLLTDGYRCNDSNNFNMLLSNQVNSFDITDEEITAEEVGKTYGGHSMFYGQQYTGRGAGEFSCSFAETQDLSVMKMMKLWITYIDNVSRGAWSPSYNLYGYNKDGSFGRSKNDSHVYSKTLDYAASVYVLKCGPTGSDLLYWTKYYGVFPIVTGSSALSWNGNPIGGESPRLTIRFKYCYKRDLSFTSLVELNENSGIQKMLTPVAEAAFNPNYNHTARPYVGAPFIEICAPAGYLANTGNNSDMYGKPRTEIKLKFLVNTDDRLSDELLYRSPYSQRRTDLEKQYGEVQLC